MAKFLIEIPDEIVELAKKRNGSVKKYFRAVLVNPLLSDYEQQRKEQIYQPKLDELEKELQDVEKSFTIKSANGNGNGNSEPVEETSPVEPSPEPTPEPAPDPEPAPAESEPELIFADVPEK